MDIQYHFICPFIMTWWYVDFCKTKQNTFYTLLCLLQVWWINSLVQICLLFGEPSPIFWGASDGIYDTVYNPLLVSAIMGKMPLQSVLFLSLVYLIDVRKKMLLHWQIWSIQPHLLITYSVRSTPLGPERQNAFFGGRNIKNILHAILFRETALTFDPDLIVSSAMCASFFACMLVCKYCTCAHKYKILFFCISL